MNYKKSFSATRAALMIVIAVTLMLAPGAWAASKYKSLYRFKGGKDGSGPNAGLVFDAAGNLYGTTGGGGKPCNCGVVFKLHPHPDGSWTESVLYRFSDAPGDARGKNPSSGLVFDAAGNLFGTTYAGGFDEDCFGYGCGTLFRMHPHPDGSWSESTAYTFNDGPGSSYGGLIFDAAGNLYGLSANGIGEGCDEGCGAVYEAQPNPTGGWTVSLLHSFTDFDDGSGPGAPLVFDAAGNLYGTVVQGGLHFGGDVYELSPSSGGGWTESILYSFTNGNDGENPGGGLVFDAAGSLYGAAAGGADESGVVFKLTRGSNANGSWRESLLHTFTGGADGKGPGGGLIFDGAGNLYGAAGGGGAHGFGVVFKLMPTASGGWKYRVLHSFRNLPGAYPGGNLIFDRAGNLYGVTGGDGKETLGSVFEITP